MIKRLFSVIGVVSALMLFNGCADSDDSATSVPKFSFTENDSLFAKSADGNTVTFTCNDPAFVKGKSVFYSSSVYDSDYGSDPVKFFNDNEFIYLTINKAEGKPTARFGFYFYLPKCNTYVVMSSTTEDDSIDCFSLVQGKKKDGYIWKSETLQNKKLMVEKYSQTNGRSKLLICENHDKLVAYGMVNTADFINSKFGYFVEITSEDDVKNTPVTVTFVKSDN